MKNLLNYFIISIPGPEMRFFIPLFIISGSLISAAIIFSMIYKKKKKTNLSFKVHFKSLSKILLFLGFGLLFLTLMRFENIPYFSMRIWLYAMCFLIIYTAFYYLNIYKVAYLKDIKSKMSRPKTEEKRYTTAKKRK